MCIGKFNVAVNSVPLTLTVLFSVGFDFHCLDFSYNRQGSFKLDAASIMKSQSTINGRNVFKTSLFFFKFTITLNHFACRLLRNLVTSDFTPSKVSYLASNSQYFGFLSEHTQ